jgi:hypothetical protein
LDADTQQLGNFKFVATLEVVDHVASLLVHAIDTANLSNNASTRLSVRFSTLRTVPSTIDNDASKRWTADDQQVG